ncbi:MAG: cell division protein FtsZ [Alcaligenaceae bacterium]|nr:cell division protein FtsZ [Alcaligenaceae bacterium]
MGNRKFQFDLEAKDNGNEICIKVIGVGGAGGNAINRMIDMGYDNVEYIAANTDRQALNHSKASTQICLGFEGNGAGANPEEGRRAAESVKDDIRNALQGAHMLFITAGMGGGTGTGASPVIAEIAQDLGIITVAVVTKPFSYEGRGTMRTAEKGIDELIQHVDSYIVVLNERLFTFVDEDTATVEECYREVDKVLGNACLGISEIVRKHGVQNTDFADLRQVIGHSETGQAIMGVGKASGENRATEAANAAISCPLIEGANMNGANSILVNISANGKVTMKEIRQIHETIQSRMDEDGLYIEGLNLEDESVEEGAICVTVVATGFGRKHMPSIVVDNDPVEDIEIIKTGTDDVPVDPFVGLGLTRPTDTPTIVRTKGAGHSVFSSSSETANLELPTFLRKQKN